MRLRAVALAVLVAASLTLVLSPARAGEVSDRDIKVGRLQRAFVDTTRSDWSGEGARPLAATIWYRARDDSTETDWKGGVFRFGRTASGAPFARAEPAALIVMSHGTGGSSGQLSWLAEALVRDGFIVAAVNHHGNTALEESQAVAGYVLPGERSRDLSVLIDRLLADEQIGPHIDPNRIGAAGFSLGGFTALSLAGLYLTFDEIRAQCEAGAEIVACRFPSEAKFTLADVRAGAESDPAFRAAIGRSTQAVVDARIRAVYAIAPALLPLVPAERWSAIQVPSTIVVADKDRQVQAEVLDPLIRRVLPAADLVRVADAGHYVFLAVCSLRGLLLVGTLCRDPDVTDRAEVHDRIGRDAARFFDAKLGSRDAGGGSPGNSNSNSNSNRPPERDAGGATTREDQP